MESSTLYASAASISEIAGSASAERPASKSASRKFSLQQLRDLLRRSVLTTAFVLIHALLPLGLIGWLNKRFGFIHSLFLCYPASSRFSRYFVFDFLIDHLRWRPAVYGVFVQGGKLGILMATSTTEREFTRSSNGEQVELLKSRVHELQRRLVVPQVHYAGILPRYMRGDDAADVSGESAGPESAVAEIVLDAYLEVAGTEELGSPPVILLGGLGAVGSQLGCKLRARGVEVHVVDKRQGAAAWPKHLNGQPCILIDVARRGARADYIDQFWPELVYLNETYPEPRGRDLERLIQIGMKVHHVVGIKGTAFPAFPHGYRGGVPCCAMHRPESAKVVVEELS